jgi:hypothetical protein
MLTVSNSAVPYGSSLSTANSVASMPFSYTGASGAKFTTGSYISPPNALSLHSSPISIPLTLPSSTGVTIGGWINPSSLPSTGTSDVNGAVNHGGVATVLAVGDYKITLTDGAGFGVTTSSTGSVHTPGNQPISTFLNKWVFVAASFSESTNVATLYVNGTSYTTDTAMSIDTGMDLIIGGGADEGDSFTGLVDDIFLYNSPLTTTHLDVLWLSDQKPLPPVAGQSGYAVSLSDSTYVSIKDVPTNALSSTFSIGLSIKPTATLSTHSTLLYLPSQLHLTLQHNTTNPGQDRLQLWYGDNEVITGSVEVKENKWSYISVARDGASLTIALNGDIISSTTLPSDYELSSIDTNILYIGTAPAHTDSDFLENFVGEVDSLVLYGDGTFSSTYSMPVNIRLDAAVMNFEFNEGYGY